MFSCHETKTLLERELRYPLEITETDCWLFTGGSKNGFHGTLFYRGTPQQAHRVAYKLICGEIPDGINVLHHCDVGMCVNPKHLFLGTQADNIADMDRKGRSNRNQPGEKNGRAYLNEIDVLKIRNSKNLVRELADEYNVSLTCIYKILSRTTWRHI